MLSLSFTWFLLDYRPFKGDLAQRRLDSKGVLLSAAPDPHYLGAAHVLNRHLALRQTKADKRIFWIIFFPSLAFCPLEKPSAITRLLNTDWTDTAGKERSAGHTDQVLPDTGVTG